MRSYLHAYLSGILAYFRRHISRHYVKCFPRPPLFCSISLLLNIGFFPPSQAAGFVMVFVPAHRKTAARPIKNSRSKPFMAKHRQQSINGIGDFRHYHSIALWLPLRYCRHSISLRSGNHPSLKCLDKTKSCLLHCLPSLFCSLFLCLPFLPFFLPSHNKNTRQNLRA
jgi:hypothetical protein